LRIFGRPQLRGPINGKEPVKIHESVGDDLIMPIRAA
jgi:hypothetical protein